MIIASHIKCMTSEPGLLPRDYEELDPAKLPVEFSMALDQIKKQLMIDEQNEPIEKNIENETNNGQGRDIKEESSKYSQ